MDSLAHGLWTGATAIVINNVNVISMQGYRLRTRWFVFWGVFPDLLAFGPMALTGMWLRLTGSASGSVHGGHLPHVDLGIPLYPAVHSLITFAVVYGFAAILAGRPSRALLGWLLHILIDVPTHSFSYYATRFLWPVADYGFDGVAWWTPWLFYATYGGLLVTYVLLWGRGWLRRSPTAACAESIRS